MDSRQRLTAAPQISDSCAAKILYLYDHMIIIIILYILDRATQPMIKSVAIKICFQEKNTAAQPVTGLKLLKTNVQRTAD